MNKFLVLCVVLLVVCVSCTAQPTPAPTAVPTQPPPTNPPPPTATQLPPPTATKAPAPTAAPPTSTAAPVKVQDPGQPLISERDKYFAASGVCVPCHQNMQDASGKQVGFDLLWRASTMANSARDPYWQATVRSEVLAHPALREVIEDKCATCHMPMARTSAAFEGGKGKVLDDGLLNANNKLNPLAMDGISCSFCHAVENKNFGQPSTFSGGYTVNKDAPEGKRPSYGPFKVDDASNTMMSGASGFIGVESKHIQQSEMCATCHNLKTPFVNAKGEVAGEFAEQTPYTEWLNSDYKATTACQGCHMPAVNGDVRIALGNVPARKPVAQHAFGGSPYMLEIFKSFGKDMQATASTQQFDEEEARVLELFQKRTAAVSLEDAKLDGGKLKVNVVVKSMAGHKFPTSFPSRRAWLHVTVKDASGKVVFESGAVKPNGSIAGNDNDADATKFEPHYSKIENADQVQIYEAIMKDTEGKLTTTLLKGAAYIKDNRILPAGFKKGASPDIAVQGEADKDENFVAGSDKVQYEVGLGDAKGPFTVTVEVLYQSIGYRWAENLRQQNAAEITRFLNYYQATPNLPVVVATATGEVK